MKEQIIRLILFVFIFTINPLLAMDLSHMDDEKKGIIHKCPSCHPELLFTVEEVEKKGIHIIPADIILKFIEDLPTALAFSRTSKSMYNLCQRASLWRLLIKEPSFIDPSFCVKEQVKNLYSFFEDKLVLLFENPDLESLNSIKQGELGLFSVGNSSWNMQLNCKVHNKESILIYDSDFSGSSCDRVKRTLSHRSSSYPFRNPKREDRDYKEAIKTLSQETRVTLRNHTLLRYSPPLAIKFVIKNIDYNPKYGAYDRSYNCIAINGDKDDEKNYDSLLYFGASQSTHATIIKRWTNFSLYTCEDVCESEGDAGYTTLMDKINDYNISKVQEIHIEIYNKEKSSFPDYKIQEIPRDSSGLLCTNNQSL